MKNFHVLPPTVSIMKTNQAQEYSPIIRTCVIVCILNNILSKGVHTGVNERRIKTQNMAMYFLVPK